MSDIQYKDMIYLERFAWWLMTLRNITEGKFSNKYVNKAYQELSDAIDEFDKDLAYGRLTDNG